MKKLLLLALFSSLMADEVFGWGLGLARGLSLKNLLLYLLLGLMAIEFTVSNRKLLIELPQVHLFFGLLFFIAFLSWLSNSMLDLYVPYSAAGGLVALKGALLDHYLFFLVFFLGARTSDDVLWLQRWLLLIIGMGNLATVLDAYGLVDIAAIDTRGDGRVEGTFGEANQYGLFLAMFLPILVARAWAEQGVWRVTFTILASATGLSLLLTVSRGAFLALVLGAGISGLLLRNHISGTHLRRFVVLGALALVGAMALIGQEYWALIKQRTVMEATYGDTFDLTSGRTWIWGKALGTMLAQPLSLLTGYGWNTFRGTIGIAPHSTYVGYFFDLGIWGLGAFLGLLWTVVLWGRRAIDGADPSHPLRPGLIGFVFGFCALSVGLAGVDLADPWYFIWAYAGLAMRGESIVVNRPLGERTIPAGSSTGHGDPPRRRAPVLARLDGAANLDVPDRT